MRFYYYVGNIGTRNLSSLRNISLLPVIEAKKLKKHGYQKVLDPLIADVKSLETDGIVIYDIHNEKDCQVFGTIATVSADNLGAHDLGGFRKCFSSGRICRYCMCLYDELKHKYKESDFVLRTPSNYAKHLEGIQVDSSLSSVYGIASDCPLNQLSEFSAVNCFPPDLMHDCYEGIIPNFMQFLFRSLADGRLIRDINARINEFQFGVTDVKNKPKPDVVFYQGQISVSASESWCLFRLLPFIIGDVVAEDNYAWKMYMLLADIFDIIMAPEQEVNDISYLQMLIPEFLSSFAAHSPDLFKPKFHFLVHYPTLMKKFGPLRHLWCMRFESFHRKIKKNCSKHSKLCKC